MVGAKECWQCEYFDEDLDRCIYSRDASCATRITPSEYDVDSEILS